jgi:type IV pilus assembly protein PilC
MSKFSYVARDIDGTLYKGAIEASDKKEVRQNLRQKGFYPTTIKNTREWSQLRLFSSITGDEVAIFAEQLSVMVDAGMPLVKCLSTLANQTKNVTFNKHH